MIDRSWQPRALNFTVTHADPRDSDTQILSAQMSEDGQTLVVRLVNTDANPRTFRIDVRGFESQHTAQLVTLRADSLDAANPPGQPDLVSPVSTTVNFPGELVLQGYSVNTLVLQKQT